MLFMTEYSGKPPKRKKSVWFSSTSLRIPYRSLSCPIQPSISAAPAPRFNWLHDTISGPEISRNNDRTPIANRYWIGSDGSYAKDDEKASAVGKQVRVFIYNSYSYIQNWRYPDWWNTFRSIASRRSHFRTACRHGSNGLVI